MQTYQKLLKNIQQRIKVQKTNKNTIASPSSSSSSAAAAASSKQNGGKETSSALDKEVIGRDEKGLVATISSSSSSSPSSGISSVVGSNMHKLEDLLKPMPSLKDVSNADERKENFMKKLKLCCIVFDFTQVNDDQNYVLAKEMKRTFLLELVEYISQAKNWFSEEIVPLIYEMISINLFRSLPPPMYCDFDPEEDEPNFDAAWPHLQFVYEFFHRFVMTADVGILRKYANRQLLLNIINLFNSEDPRERDYLKMILHRIYGRCMPFRCFIRKSVNNILFHVIYSDARHNGISELLEILGSIINGFALPLKEEHTRFLRNVLVPMHKVSTLSQFHAQLSYCVTQFIQKDPQLASMVIGGMLRYWPAVSCQKELLFLNELEEVLELTGSQQLEKVIEPLFQRISYSICSNHFQVAERALFLWNNDIIATFTSDHKKKILPIIYPALQKNYTKHWNSTVSSLTLNIIRIFKEMDKELYEQVANKYKTSKDSTDPDQKSKNRREKWKQLAQQSKLNAK